MIKKETLYRASLLAILMILVLACRRAEQAEPAAPDIPTMQPTAGQTTAAATEDQEQPAGQQDCEDSMAFVADVSIPDGFVMAGGEAFIKTWRIKNSGTCFWSGYQLVFESGEPMGTLEQAIPDTPAGEELDISVEMTAPGGAGSYTGRWDVRDPNGNGLGGLTCVITVPGAGEEEDEEISSDSGDSSADASVPAAPSNFRITGWGMDTVAVAWDDNSTNEDGFRIRRVGVGWLKNPTGPDVTSFDIHTACGESHEYRVIAFNSAGDSDPSNTITVDGSACE